MSPKKEFEKLWSLRVNPDSTPNSQMTGYCALEWRWNQAVIHGTGVLQRLNKNYV